MMTNWKRLTALVLAAIMLLSPMENISGAFYRAAAYAEETGGDALQPTVEPTAAPTAEPTAEPTVPVPEQELTINCSTNLLSVYVGESSAEIQASVNGGFAPYQVTLEVNVGSERVYESTIESAGEGTLQFSYLPLSFGVHEFVVTVTDALVWAGFF